MTNEEKRQKLEKIMMVATVSSMASLKLAITGMHEIMKHCPETPKYKQGMNDTFEVILDVLEDTMSEIKDEHGMAESINELRNVKDELVGQALVELQE